MLVIAGVARILRAHCSVASGESDVGRHRLVIYILLFFITRSASSLVVIYIYIYIYIIVYCAEVVTVQVVIAKNEQNS